MNNDAINNKQGNNFGEQDLLPLSLNLVYSPRMWQSETWVSLEGAKIMFLMECEYLPPCLLQTTVINWGKHKDKGTDLFKMPPTEMNELLLQSTAIASSCLEHLPVCLLERKCPFFRVCAFLKNKKNLVHPCPDWNFDICGGKMMSPNNFLCSASCRSMFWTHSVKYL